MKAAALVGTLAVDHPLPANARLLCSPGQEVAAGAPIAEVRAPQKVRAVALKYLDGAAIGDQVPAGTVVGAGGGWRGRRQEIEWDARVVALNPASGHAFLAGPEMRSPIRARIAGQVATANSDRTVEITGEGLAAYCPLARGPSVFGTLRLAGVAAGQPAEEFADATILVVDSSVDPGRPAMTGTENLVGLLMPGLPGAWLAGQAGGDAAADPTDPTPLAFAALEAVAADAISGPLRSALEVFAGKPASLAVNADSGTGELVVSGSFGDGEFDYEAVRGFGPEGIVRGRRIEDAAGFEVRVAGGRLLAGVRIAGGRETHALAAVNVETIVASSAGAAGRG